MKNRTINDLWDESDIMETSSHEIKNNDKL